MGGKPMKDEYSEKEKLRRLLLDAIENEEGVDEDELITEGDKEKKVVIKEENKPRRACADCTCGKAEKKPVKKSSCGNCYKGDLFRCQGCPSFGLPPYEPGDVVSFDDL